MAKRLAIIILATAILVTFVSSSWASDTTLSRGTLKGITAVSVLVEELDEAAKKWGLSQEDIQTDVELKLRQAGLRVVTFEEQLKLPGMPSLYVSIIASDDARSAAVQVELDQNARLEISGRNAFVATWSSPTTVITNPTGRRIREIAKAKVDKFVDAWLLLNPKE
jgi:hypothetical protein